MFLAIDVGNTQTTFGIFENDKLKFTFRLSTKTLFNKEESLNLLYSTFKSISVKNTDILKIGISSVVPSVDKSIEEIIFSFIQRNAFFITPSINLPFKLLVDNPLEVGADRICNVAAGYKKYGGPLVIVDFGTATVYDVISKEGDFIGGIIAPGILISARALFQAAEKLPEVELIFPEKVIGTNTITNMQSGIMFSALDAFEGIIKRIITELDDDIKIILTGGFSKLIASKTSLKTFLEFDLVLEGIKILTERCDKQ